MPRVETVVDIANVDLDDVWGIVSAFERYPETMTDVIEVRWLERGQDLAISSWRVLLNGSELTWTEADVFHTNTRIDFEQREGDLEVWRGAWLLEQHPSGVTITLNVEFDLGVPSLAQIMDPLGSRAIRANSHSMLNTIRELAAAKQVQT